MDFELIFAFAENFLGIASENIHISFIFEKMKNKVCGHMHQLDVEEYEIYLNEGLSLSDMMRTIFHEMVHVKQYHSGKYIEGRHASFWKGKRCDTFGDEYFNLPWEVEAFAMETEMVIKFMDVLKAELEHVL